MIQKISQYARRLEDGALVAAFALVALLPLTEALIRPIRGLSIPGLAGYTQQAVLWLTFLGGLLATREKKHIVLSTSELMGKGRVQEGFKIFAYTVAAAVCGILVFASWQVVMADKEGGQTFASGFPVWISELIMPLALSIISLRFAWQAGHKWWHKVIAAAMIPLIFLLGFIESPEILRWPLVALVIAGAILGAPMFIAMAGVALVLFFSDYTPVSTVMADVYRLLGSPTLPAIPLLTGAGYILAESKASGRLVRLFRAAFGWMPGGVAIAVTVLCAVFTTMTGGSGVTILALGGLVLGIMVKDGYQEGFSMGLVTASGSLGLLFFPAVPVILYAVVAQVPADKLFIAGFVPGIVLLILVGVYAGIVGGRIQPKRTPFVLKELGSSLWAAKWELSLPVLIAVLFFGGFTGMVEAAAAAFVYAVIIACFVNRDMHIAKELPQVLVKAGVLVGAVLILLSSALGFTSFLVLAQIPDALVDFATTNTDSQFVFLLGLNIVLLILGSVLEIYAAIIVLAPIVAALGVAYEVHPVHLGIIFIANLEVGFLCPPVGLNLLLSSSRFEKPLTQLYRYVLPYLIIMGIGVLLITYVDGISVGVLRLFGAD